MIYHVWINDSLLWLIPPCLVRFRNVHGVYVHICHIHIILVRYNSMRRMFHFYHISYSLQWCIKHGGFQMNPLYSLLILSDESNRIQGIEGIRATFPNSAIGSIYAANALKHSLIGQFVKFFLLIGQQSSCSVKWITPIECLPFDDTSQRVVLFIILSILWRIEWCLYRLVSLNGKLSLHFSSTLSHI